MSPDVYLSFLAASALLLILPGPTVMLVIGYSLSPVAGGRRVLPALMAGVALGDLTSLSLSLAGLGAVLAASATLFTVLKLLGAAYLIWLGAAMWRADPNPPTDIAANPAPRRVILARAWLVTALNPKSIAFFVAFLPQFVDPLSPFAPQAALLTVSFTLLAALNVMAYGLLAGRVGAGLATPRARRVFHRLGGATLIGAGLATAAARRGA